MIRDLMEREVIAAAARRVRSQLLAVKSDQADSEGIANSDVDKTIQEIDKWNASEAQDIAGGHHPVWIPSDPIAALIQTVVEDYFFASKIVSVPETPHAAEQFALGSISLPAASRSWLLGQAQKAYEGWDPRWLTQSAAAMTIRALRGGKHPFPAQQPQSKPLSNRARLLLVGDWGSGLDGAQRVATAMRMSAEEGIADNREVHLMHLGDVYYTGFSREYDRKLLRYWPGHFKNATVGSWCLNGNHDMYSGGYGYFDHLLKKEPFLAQDGLSTFVLENDHWVLVGLDTAYQPVDRLGLYGDLGSEQLAWAAATLQRAAAQGKNGILLSHHQPFSAYAAESADAARLRQRLQGPLSQGLVHGWFWGHEHRCAFYKPDHGVRYPCLVGHGGVPEYPLGGPQPDSVIYEHQDYLPIGYGEDTYLQFGFAVLDFNDQNIQLSFVSELGETKPEAPLALQWQKPKS
jgi:Calcineurin-like phosphoesterase